MLCMYALYLAVMKLNKAYLTATMELNKSCTIFFWFVLNLEKIKAYFLDNLLGK